MNTYPSLYRRAKRVSEAQQRVMFGRECIAVELFISRCLSKRKYCLCLQTIFKGSLFNCPQIFCYSHHSYSYFQLQQADICCKPPENTKPPRNKYAQHLKLIQLTTNQ